MTSSLREREDGPDERTAVEAMGRDWRVNAETLTMADAAKICGISLRQLRRIRRGVAEEGKEVLFHGNRPPANRTDRAVSDKVIALRRKKHDGFSDATFAAKPWREEEVGVKLSGRGGAQR